MEPTRRSFIGTVSASLAIGVAGCTDGDAPDTTAERETATPSDATPVETTTAAHTTTDTLHTTDEPETTTAEPAAPTRIAVRSHPEHGRIIVDGDGLTLYVFGNDPKGAGESACTGGCATSWPPVTTDTEPEVGDGVSAEVTTFERSDGTTQVAVNGWPLYYYAPDSEPGDATGQGVGDVWWVVAPDGTPRKPKQATVTARSHSEHGEILVDGDGRTLYLFENDTKGGSSSACTGGCTDTWPPLTTEAEPEVAGEVEGEVTTFEREDGTKQVAVGGWPLYYYQGDESPGDAGGQGAADVWWVVAPDGTPRKPVAASVTVRSHAEHGDILADGEGMTLYLFERDTQGESSSACTGSCTDNWPPLTTEAAPAAGPGVTAELTTFEREDGARQVAANGWPLYYYQGDESPGEVNGQGVGDVWWVLAPDGTPRRSTSNDDEGGGYDY